MYPVAYGFSRRLCTILRIHVFGVCPCIFKNVSFLKGFKLKRITLCDFKNRHNRSLCFFDFPIFFSRFRTISRSCLDFGLFRTGLLLSSVCTLRTLDVKQKFCFDARTEEEHNHVFLRTRLIVHVSLFVDNKWHSCVENNWTWLVTKLLWDIRKLWFAQFESSIPSELKWFKNV